MRSVSWIVALLDESEKEAYAEPFCGGLEVLLARKGTHIEIANDLNKTVIAFWRLFQSDPEGLLDFFHQQGVVYHEALYTRAKNIVRGCAEADSIYEKAWAVWYGWATSFSGGQSFAYTVNKDFPLLDIRAKLTALRMLAHRINKCTFFCRDGVKLTQQLAKTPHSLLYIDLPHLDLPNYRKNVRKFTEEDLKAVCESLSSTECDWALKSYKHPVVTALAEKFRVVNDPASDEFLVTNLQ